MRDMLINQQNVPANFKLKGPKKLSPLRKSEEVVTRSSPSKSPNKDDSPQRDPNDDEPQFVSTLKIENPLIKAIDRE